MATPAHKIRISNITTIIWRNSGDKGNWYSANFARSYQTDDGWRDTDAFGFDDLLTLNKVSDLAHTWIVHQMAANRKGRKEQVAA